MTEWIYNNPILAAFLATLFTYGVTALGSALVFPFKNVSKKLFNGLLGFSAGVMIAASFWSLLSPSIDLAEDLGMIPWVPAVVGFLFGGLFLLVVDRYLPHMHIMTKHKEGVNSSWHRSILLVLAITLHNIPEGLAVGVAFGYAAVAFDSSIAATAAIGGAIALAIGIGLQNFPEGAAVSVPLRREGMSSKKAFMIGQIGRAHV